MLPRSNRSHSPSHAALLSTPTSRSSCPKALQERWLTLLHQHPLRLMMSALVFVGTCLLLAFFVMTGSFSLKQASSKIPSPQSQSWKPQDPVIRSLDHPKGIHTIDDLPYFTESVTEFQRRAGQLLETSLQQSPPRTHTTVFSAE